MNLRFNSNHDEAGRFASASGVAKPANGARYASPLHVEVGDAVTARLDKGEADGVVVALTHNKSSDMRWAKVKTGDGKEHLVYLGTSKPKETAWLKYRGGGTASSAPSKALSVTQHADYKTRLSTGEVEALQSYTGGASSTGLVYDRISNHLRQGAPLGAGDDQVIRHIDSALSKATVGPGGATVYRGIDGDMAARLKPGVVIRDKGFVSASTQKHVAQDFADEKMRGKVVKINLPEGMHFAPLESVTLKQGEHEVLLPRGLSFTAVRRGGQIELDAGV